MTMTQTLEPILHELLISRGWTVIEHLWTGSSESGTGWQTYSGLPKYYEKKNAGHAPDRYDVGHALHQQAAEEWLRDNGWDFDGKHWVHPEENDFRSYKFVSNACNRQNGRDISARRAAAKLEREESGTEEKSAAWYGGLHTDVEGNGPESPEKRERVLRESRESAREHKKKH